MSDVTTKLSELVTMYKNNMLTDDEFSQAKARLLGAKPEQPQALTDLDVMKQRGLLTDAEYQSARQVVTGAHVTASQDPRRSNAASAGKQLPGGVQLSTDEHLVCYYKPAIGFDMTMIRLLLPLLFLTVILIPLALSVWKRLPNRMWFYLTSHRAIHATDKEVQVIPYAQLKKFSCVWLKGRWVIDVHGTQGRRQHFTFFNMEDARHEFVSVLELAQRAGGPAPDLYEYQGPVDWA